MQPSSIFLGFGLIALVSASGYYPRAANASADATNCTTSGVHMIIARASTEAPGEGIIGAVATMVKQAIPGSDSEAVDYPATLTQYQASEQSGVAAMTKLVQEYTARCPDSKIAVMGYSQGAQVAADMMCGVSEKGFSNATQALSAADSKNVVAMVLMGDPSHVSGQSFDAGTAKKTGLFPRQNLAACPAAQTVSFCDDNDEFCDSGNSLQVHLSYVTKYGTQAAKFVTDKVSGNASNSTKSQKGSDLSKDKANEGSSSRALGFWSVLLASVGLGFVLIWEG
ncbi:hypothetical protein CJF32_00001907 [Rutstroemia sp. NJR-2017a WRK4]|nr:hypothetical protein CJF32_00001907 [Rutstroemia sp. NJR-2017a WRK4]